jgi:hypothetical protein
MPGQKNTLDTYLNWAVLEVAGAVATTGTVVTQLQTGITNLQKVAWEVSRIEYWIPEVWLSHAKMSAAASAIVLGLTQSASTSQSFSPRNQAGVDWFSIGGQVVASSVGIQPPHEQPFLHDFRDNPRLALPQCLYGALTWLTDANLTAVTALIKIWYREIELTEANWYDLLQLRLPLGATV